ncbi:MAG: PAS domain S-box protein [Betaproteobacteria bacterium]|nr:PAS domain S-box protein [Betaproteobacteria bacterium]
MKPETPETASPPTSSADAVRETGDALRIVLVYAAAASLWILLSDKIVDLLFGDPALITLASTLKGWVFVGVTALLLYRLLQRGPGGGSPAAPAPGRRPGALYLTLGLVAALIVALTAGAVVHLFAYHRDREVARLQAIADLKSRQIADWLKERHSDALHVQTATFLAQAYRRWTDANDTASRDQLLGRLETFRKNYVFRSVLLLDERGGPLWDSEGAPAPVGAALRAAALNALAMQKSGQLGPYRDAKGRLNLDFVTFLPAVDGRPSAVVVLRADPATHLYPTLQTWPVPSASGETLLFKRDGDDVVFLNDLRHSGGAAVQLRFPIGSEKLLAAQVLRGEVRENALAEGVDYRRVPVMGVVRGVPGSDWFLVAKMDRDEVLADAFRDSIWVTLAGGLAFFLAVIGAILLHQRHRLLVSLHDSEAQAGKLRALQLLDTIANSSTDAIFAKDLGGRYLLFNNRAARVTGQSAEAVLGRDDTVLFPPEQAAQVMDNDRAVIAGGEVVTFVERLDTVGGESVFLATKGPLRNAGGETVGMFGISRDITEQKKAEEHNRKLSMAVEQSPESIVITDLGGQIEYVNAAFIRNTGYSRAEAVGQNPRFLHSGKTPKDTYDALWKTMQQGLSWRGEFFNRRKDGSEYTEFAIVTPIRQTDGRITHYVAVKEDITEKKRIGCELDQHRHHLQELVESRTAQLAEARERAEAANRAKSVFLANMSHEIRTPMNAIIGLTHILRRDNPRPEQAERLARVGTAAAHLLDVINDILDLSKIEANRLKLEHADFSLADLLAHTCTLIGEQAIAKGLQLEVDGGSVPLWLRGDPTRLRQALLNFAGNAIKFTERGVISVLAHLLEDDGRQVLVRFEVRDTGIGIPADKLSGLFRAFEQADTSTTRKYGGTGLGLTITRELARLMGGDAGATSEPGQGSRFWFTARLEHGRSTSRGAADGLSAASATAGAEAELRQRHAGAHLLLADDNPVNLEVALELLAAVGLRVDTAQNGRQALDKATAYPYDLILMDLQMPELDGLAATRAIRALPDRQSTPILAMTANAFDEDRRICLAEGMNDFVAKPVDPNALYANLLKWLPAKNRPAVTAPQAAAESGEETGEEEDPLLRQRLAGIPGFDLEAALAMMRGKTAKVAKLLLLFADGHAGDVGLLAQSVCGGELAEVERLAHGLKGSAGNLRATAVAGAAAALLDAVRRNAGTSDIESLRAALAGELAALIAGIRAALPGPAIP